MRVFKGVIAAAVLGILPAISHAAVLVGYNLATNTDGSATTTYAGFTGTTLTRGAGVTSSGLSGGFSSNNWDATTQAEALTGNEYLQFGFTVGGTENAAPQLAAMVIRRSSSHAPSNFILAYSTDNFGGVDETTNPLIATTFTTTTDTSTATNGAAITPVDISSMGSFAPGTTVTFRLYGWLPSPGTTTTSSTMAIGKTHFDNLNAYDLEINGVVPEPASLSLLGLGSVALLRRRRA